MARPSGAKEADPLPSQLPAPYAPPWLRLGDDVRAMAAWLQLKLRELWRRNWDGSLPLPVFWPRPWSQLFWPVVVAAMLLAGLALGRGLLGSFGGRAGGQPEAAQPPALLQHQDPKPSPEEAEALALRPPLPTEFANKDATESAPDPPLPPPEPPATDPLPSLAGAELEDTSAQAPAVPEGGSTAAQGLVATVGEDPEHLMAALRVEAETGTLVVELSERFGALPAPTRQDWAERWQQRAGNLGYDHLELRDGEQRLVGRDAQVGGGMILLLPLDRVGDAGGSPSRAGQGDRSDGDVRNQAQRTGGTLGAAPDGLARGIRGLRRWRGQRPDGNTDGGEHGQPPLPSR